MRKGRTTHMTKHAPPARARRGETCHRHLHRPRLDGHPTAVWNRTASKADALVSKGAALASTPAEAVEARELVVVCVLELGRGPEGLKPVTDQLARRSLVMLTSLSPAEAERPPCGRPRTSQPARRF
ncbi:NAD(P)-binding domain-containing protein [Streptomyces virginiae]|uniref:NAD(P)-binding domain-containing protein n=1 Tax=Streptomyces virginiae TaxID=1961 RepID=UPI0034511A1D